MVSDGLADAVGPGGEFFGEDRTLAILRQQAGRPVADIVSALRRGVETFCGSTPPRDDVSLLGLEYVRPKG